MEPKTKTTSPHHSKHLSRTTSSGSTGQRLSINVNMDTLLYTLSEKNLAEHVQRDLEEEECDEQRLRTQSAPLSSPDSCMLAPDGGYGWCVTLGSFISHLIEGGVERGEGIFLLHFLHRFKQTNQMSALPTAVATTLRCFLSPLASTMCNRYSIRASALLGGIVFTVGMFLTQFVENFYLLLLTYGVLTGVGRAFFSGPALIVIGLYFRRRQGLASGMATSGVGVGSFVLVPFFQYMFEELGYQNAFLLMSGIAANMIFVAMLYRPLSVDFRYRNFKCKRRQQSDGDSALRPTSEDVKGTPSPVIARDPHTMIEIAAPVVSEIPVKAKDQSSRRCYRCCRCCGCFCRLRRRLCKNCCCKICCPVESFNKSPGAKASMCQCGLLSHKPFFFYCTTLFFFTVGFKVVYVFLPSLVISKGYTSLDAAFIISFAGILDVFTRIGIGVLVDMPRIRPYRMHMFNVYLVVLAAACVLIPLAPDLLQITLATTMFSLGCGMCFATRTLVLVDLLGVPKLASSFGLLMMFQGFGTLLGPPLAGFILDETHDPRFGFLMGACSLVMSAVGMQLTIRVNKQYCEQRTWHR